MGRQIDRVPRLRTREGRYYVVWHDDASGKTKKRSLGTADEGEAKKAYARFLLEDGQALQPRGSLLTVERALHDYLREHVDAKDTRKPVADKERQRYAAEHLIAHFGQKPISEIDIPASRGYVAARRKGLIGGGKRRKDKVGSASTVRRELNVLTAAARHAYRWKRIDTLPSIELPAEERRDNDEIADYFERDVLQRLFDAADKAIAAAQDGLKALEGNPRQAAAKTALRTAVELKRWMRLAYYTAGRRRSVENLTAAQVNLFRRQIALATPGKPRTKKRQPIVPIFDQIVGDVAALLEEHPTGRLFETTSFYRPFMSLCRSIDLPEPHHPHMLRHSRATHLLQDGKDLWDVAALLGDTIRTVEATYGHHSPAALRGKLS